MQKVRRSSSLFRAGVTSVATPIGKFGQRTLDAGQTEVKQLWGFIEKAFYPKEESEGEGEEGAGSDGEEQAWEESPQGLEEVNIFLDHLGGVSEDSSSSVTDPADLSSGSSAASSSSASGNSPSSRRSTLTSSGGMSATPALSSSGGGTAKAVDHNSFVVKIKKGKDMAHKIMFYGVEKVTHLGRGGHKKKKDDEPDGLVEPRAVVGLCGKKGAEPALIEVSMGCIISCSLQLQGSLALPKKLKNRRMLTKNTPRVLYGKQEGWVLELYTPPQADNAPSTPKGKHKHKREEDIGRKEDDHDKHQAQTSHIKEKDQEPAERTANPNLTSSTSSAEIDEKHARKGKGSRGKTRSGSQDQASDKERQGEADYPLREEKHKKRKKTKKSKTNDNDQSSGVTPSPDQIPDSSKERSGSVIIHETESNSSNVPAELLVLESESLEWFESMATEMVGWHKLELAARTPHQIMAWRHFFQTGSTEDGRKEISGFLWVKHRDVWDRYFCIAGQDYIEWLKPGAANLIPLNSLTNLRRGILTEKEQHKLQAKKKKEDWDKSHYLSKIRLAKYKLTLLKQNDTLFSFVTPSRNILVAIATHLIAQKGLDNLITHNRTLLDEVDSAKAIATKSEYKVKRNYTTFSIRKRSEAKGKEPTLVPIHRRTVSNSEPSDHKHAETKPGGVPSPPSGHGDLAHRNQQFLDSVGDEASSGEHFLRKSTIEETKETTKLRNEMRDAHERAILEMGKTPFGNSNFDKRDKLCESSPIDKSNKDYFILSLDGGGLRGVILTTLLVRLVEVFPDLMEKVDLFAGVSAGSIVASSLATGRSPVFMQKMLRIMGPILFMVRNVRQFHGYPLRLAKYSMLNLKIVLEESLRGATLDTCPRNLLISTFLLDNQKQGSKRSWDPRVYHNLPRNREAATTDSDEEDDPRSEEDPNANTSHQYRAPSTNEHAMLNGRKLVMGRSQSEQKVELRGRDRMRGTDLETSLGKRRKHEAKQSLESKNERRRTAKDRKLPRDDSSIESLAKAENVKGIDNPLGPADHEGKAKEVTLNEESPKSARAEANKEISPIQLMLRWPSSRKTSQLGSDLDLRPATSRESTRGKEPRYTDAYSDETAESMHHSFSGLVQSTSEVLTREKLGLSRKESFDSPMLNRKLSSRLRKPSLQQIVPSPLSAGSESSGSKINSKPGKETVEALEVDKDTLLMDLVLASAAAPTFFPSHRCHVDGAIVSNNPSLAAITTVLSPDTIGTPKHPSKVHVLSIGTGYITRYIETNNDHDWGVLQWAPWLSELMLYTAQMNSTKLSATLLGDNYHRLDPQLDKAIPMDDPSLMPLLEQKAMEVDLGPTIAWIKRHVYGEKDPTLVDGGTKRKKTKRKKKKNRGDTKARVLSSDHLGENGTEGSKEDAPHSNMHWGTDAWFATQRMWDG